MSNVFVAELKAERYRLSALLAKATAGKNGVGGALGPEASTQLAETIQLAISNIDTSLRIIADAHRT